jgi:ubiquinone/menaquinone biosynthesis C-methylase UbiE
MKDEEVWDKIAEQWYHFRQKPFYELRTVLDFSAKKWKPGKILDIGTGNARNLLVFAKHRFKCYGIDFSSRMLGFAKRFARENRFHVNLEKARAEKLPYKNRSFDYALNIALLQHIPKESHLKAVKEMHRVLKAKGKAVVTAWNKWQPQFIFRKKELLIPWHVKGTAYNRYHYLFNYFELRNLLKEAGFKITYSRGMFKRLLIFIVEK